MMFRSNLPVGLAIFACNLYACDGPGGGGATAATAGQDSVSTSGTQSTNPEVTDSVSTTGAQSASSEVTDSVSTSGAQSTSSEGTDGASSGSGGEPQCEPPGTPGPLNPAGNISPTGTYTDWTWPDVPGGRLSFEWTLNMDFEPPNDGYFWAHQFGFAGPGAAAGYIGLQENGYYVADPPNGKPEITKMALFSIGPGAIVGESGVPYPEGRAYADFDGASGWNVHIKYAWVPCRTYALRLEHMMDELNGDQWYGGYVTDTATNVETMIGRILVPAQWGRLGGFSVYFSERFGYAAVASCDLMEHASAVFGAPTANDSTVKPASTNNHFYDPPDCPNSRFTNLPNGVRHEMGVPSP